MSSCPTPTYASATLTGSEEPGKREVKAEMPENLLRKILRTRYTASPADAEAWDGGRIRAMEIGPRTN